MLAVFENDNISRILQVRYIDCVPTVKLRRHLRLISIQAQHVQRMFGHMARRPAGEHVRGLLKPTPPVPSEGELETS